MQVSVVMPTYNHEPYISQAIESVLMQETDFEFELMIGEDGSEDNTRTIVQGYKDKYPHRIRLFLNDRRNVIYVDGHPTGLWNLMNLLRRAEGRYIALLDGDDYWIDRGKLQQQVDFLESHPDFVLCCHNTRVIEANDPEGSYFFRPDRSSLTKEVLEIQDQIENVVAFHTSSVVFRNGLVELPQFFQEYISADIILFTLLAQFGKIKFLDKVMSVYRRNDGGISVHQAGYTLHLSRIAMNHDLNQLLENRFSNIYFRLNEGHHLELIDLAIRRRDPSAFFRYCLKYLSATETASRSLLQKLWKMLILSGGTGCGLLRTYLSRNRRSRDHDRAEKPLSAEGFFRKRPM